MLYLPFKILVPIFDGLEAKKDLLQCQLTCKRWYEASGLCLYNTVTLETGKALDLYARIILGSLRLASYLKVIDSGILLLTKVRNNEETTPVSTYGSYYGAKDADNTECLLDVIIRQCPNVQEIKCDDLFGIFWQKLSEAVSQGKLLHISELANPFIGNDDYYNETALCFRNSLRSLHVCEDRLFLNRIRKFVPDITAMKLRQHISEFKRLVRLQIYFASDRQLNHLDGLIEDCPHLEEIIIKTSHAIIMNPAEVEPGMSINARPNIHLFQIDSAIKCSNMDQVEYIMQKFTQLQYLEIRFDLYSKYVYSYNNPAPNVLARFLDYLMPIEVCYVTLIVPKSNFIDAWNKFTSETDQSKEPILKCNGTFKSDSERVEVYIKQDSITVNFPVPNNSTIFPHVEFLRKNPVA